MINVTTIPFFRIFVFLVVGLYLGNLRCRGEDISSVLASPSAYHGKRVEITGIARGDSDRFYLFANASDALALKVQRTVDVFVPDHWRRIEQVTLRKVCVTGIVNANWHGHSQIPCALRLEKLEILSGPVARWPNAVSVFHNETANTIIMHFGVPPTQTEFEVPSSGLIDVRAEDGVVRATSSNGSKIAETRISQKAAGPFYDADNAASYYRIKDGKIASVLPKAAKAWGWHR